MVDRVTYLVRVRLPDRPGTLGVVATRFGALKGDVIGIDIIERSRGLAIDELLVSLPADVPLDLIIRELVAEDGVDIDDIQLLENPAYDPHLDVLEAAALLVGVDTPEELAAVLTETVSRIFRFSWVCVVGPHGSNLSSWGAPPDSRWVDSFITHRPPSEPLVSTAAPETSSVWIELPAIPAALVVGRSKTIRARELQRLEALGNVADLWLRRLGAGSYMTTYGLAGPSLVGPTAPSPGSR